MKKTVRLGIVAVIFCIHSSAFGAETTNKQYAARTELQPIQTLTLTDQQFLTGNDKGEPVTITGELRIAQGAGRLPVVVLLHGGNGLTANIDYWSRELNAMGISTFALDSMTGRRLTQVLTKNEALGRLAFTLDSYRALAVLAKHPRVDPDRIVLMGFSRGGQDALYASLTRFQRMWNKSGVEFAAYLALYPDCAMTYQAETDIADRPVRIFGGTTDDVAPVSACKSYAERLKTAGHDVEITEYPNAPHAFDNPIGAEPAAMLPGLQSVKNCKIREEANGVLVNLETSLPFSYKDACVVHGGHLGHDPIATEAATASVKTFLRQTFKLP